jgi:hypothetical protein
LTFRQRATIARPLPQTIRPDSSVETPPGDVTLEFLDLRYKRFLDKGSGIQFNAADSPGVYIDIRKVVRCHGLSINAEMSRVLYHRMA